MRQQMIEAAGGEKKLKADGVLAVAKMALVNSKKWTAGSVLRCRFLDGSAKMKSKVKAIALEWQKYADIKLQFVTKGSAEILDFFFRGRRIMVGGRAGRTQHELLSHSSTDDELWMAEGRHGR